MPQSSCAHPYRRARADSKDSRSLARPPIRSKLVGVVVARAGAQIHAAKIASALRVACARRSAADCCRAGSRAGSRTQAPTRRRQKGAATATAAAAPLDAPALAGAPPAAHVATRALLAVAPKGAAAARPLTPRRPRSPAASPASPRRQPWRQVQLRGARNHVARVFGGAKRAPPLPRVHPLTPRRPRPHRRVACEGFAVGSPANSPGAARALARRRAPLPDRTRSRHAGRGVVHGATAAAAGAPAPSPRSPTRTSPRSSPTRARPAAAPLTRFGRGSRQMEMSRCPQSRRKRGLGERAARAAGGVARGGRAARQSSGSAAHRAARATCTRSWRRHSRRRRRWRAS